MQCKPHGRNEARRLIWLGPIAGAALLYVAERSRGPGEEFLGTPERRVAPAEAAPQGPERPFPPPQARAVNLIEGRLVIDGDGAPPSTVLPPPPLHLVVPGESDLPHLIGRLSDP